jgi:hypothetical protein
MDVLYQWWSVPTNLNSYAHISHTFTHELEDNATYFDVYNEITFNQAVSEFLISDSSCELLHIFAAQKC